MLEHVGSFAKSVAVKDVGEETFFLCRELVDVVILVSHDAICASIKDMFEDVLMPENSQATTVRDSPQSTFPTSP